METTIEQKENGAPLIKYTPDEAKIAELRAQYTGLKADTPEGYQSCRLALRELVPLRTGIEDTRRQLKADSIAWGRKVDAAAKALTGKLLEIEEPIRLEKKKVDDAREAEARAIVDAEKARVAELERQAREAKEREEHAQREAEQAKLAEERRQLAIERQKMEAERKQQADEYAAKLKEERAIRDREDAERRKLHEAVEAERVRLQKIKDEVEAAERQIKERAQREKEAAERSEFERVAKIKAERDAQEAVVRARAEELARKQMEESARPDIDKIRRFGDTLAEIKPPSCAHQAAIKFLLDIGVELEKLAGRCRSYKFGGGK